MGKKLVNISKIQRYLDRQTSQREEEAICHPESRIPVLLPSSTLREPSYLLEETCTGHRRTAGWRQALLKPGLARVEHGSSGRDPRLMVQRSRHASVKEPCRLVGPHHCLCRIDRTEEQGSSNSPEDRESGEIPSRGTTAALAAQKSRGSDSENTSL